MVYISLLAYNFVTILTYLRYIREDVKHTHTNPNLDIKVYFIITNFKVDIINILTINKVAINILITNILIINILIINILTINILTIISYFTFLIITILKKPIINLLKFISKKLTFNVNFLITQYLLITFIHTSFIYPLVSLLISIYSIIQFNFLDFHF